MSYSSNNYDYSSDEARYYDQDKAPTPDPPPYQQSLKTALRQVTTVDIFAVGGRLQNHPFPSIRIQGITPSLLALPLEGSQQDALTALCVNAPFGRGEATLVDQAVRRCKQIDVSNVSLADAWDHRVQQLAKESAKSLGVKASVKANLYKVLLYDDGGFFKPHKDTEKEDGMFGTLAIQLPCKHEAGALIVRHRGEEKTFDFSEGSDLWCYYVAFFGDCEHEMTQVSGRRLVLLYNLVRITEGKVPRIMDFEDSLVQTVKDAGREWGEADGSPDRYVFLLRHKYTESSLSLDALKGADFAVFKLLQTTGMFKLQLALVELHRNFYYGDGGEIRNETNVLKIVNESDGLTPSDFKIGKRELDLETGNRVFNVKRRPDKDSFFGNMGNEGAQRDKWYFEAVLVIWPTARGSFMKWSGDYGKALAHVQAIWKSNAEEAEDLAYSMLKNISEGIMAKKTMLDSLMTVAIDIKSPRCVNLALGLFQKWDKVTCGVIDRILRQLKWDDVRVRILHVIKRSLFKEVNLWIELASSLNESSPIRQNAKDLVEAMVGYAISKSRYEYHREVFVLLRSFRYLDEELDIYVKKVKGSWADQMGRGIAAIDKEWLTGENRTWGENLLKSLFGHFIEAFSNRKRHYITEDDSAVLEFLLKLEANELVSQFVDAVLKKEDETNIKHLMRNKYVAKAAKAGGNEHVRRMFDALQSKRAAG